MKNNTKISLISNLSNILPQKIDLPKIINEVFGSILSEHLFENSISTSTNVCYLN